MTHPTDDDLDALVQMLQQRDKSKHGYTGHPLYNRNGPQAAAVITALRVQLARREEMHDSAMKERDDATIYADEQKARGDRAEAERAAQIEADAAKYGPHANEGLLQNLGLQPGDRVVRVTGHDKWSDPDIGSEYTFAINSSYRKGVPHLVKDGSGWTTMTENGTFRVIVKKPHDRTALDRMLSDAREKALREAADRLPPCMACGGSDAILALIDKP